MCIYIYMYILFFFSPRDWVYHIITMLFIPIRFLLAKPHDSAVGTGQWSWDPHVTCTWFLECGKPNDQHPILDVLSWFIDPFLVKQGVVYWLCPTVKTLIGDATFERCWPTPWSAETREEPGRWKCHGFDWQNHLVKTIKNRVPVIFFLWVTFHFLDFLRTSSHFGTLKMTASIQPVPCVALCWWNPHGSSHIFG